MARRGKVVPCIEALSPAAGPEHGAAAPRRGTVIALLGAESTGKSTLAAELTARLRQRGLDCGHVEEYLRQFCQAVGRTPRREEQAGIAAEQTRRIEAAAAGQDLVIADTTALQIAVYSDLVFGDDALYAPSEASQSAVSLTLLTALDLPWQPDGHQRDGPHVREPVDRLLRAALQRSGAAYAVVSGTGPARLAAALAAVDRLLQPARPARWTTVCAHCGDADCERRLLRGLAADGA